MIDPLQVARIYQKMIVLFQEEAASKQSSIFDVIAASTAFETALVKMATDHAACTPGEGMVQLTISTSRDFGRNMATLLLKQLAASDQGASAVAAARRGK